MASGGLSDVPIDPARLAQTIAQSSAGQSLEQVLVRAAEIGAQQCPPKSRPVAIIGIGFAPPDAAWWKGDFDPDKHPRWPAKAPEEQGGRFRIRENGGVGGELVREGAKRAMRRLVLRRALRMVLMATLRVGAEAALGPLGDVIAIIDTIRTIAELRKLYIAADAAQKFVAKAPYSLDDLGVDSEFQSFLSHEAFVKDSRQSRNGSSSDSGRPARVTSITTSSSRAAKTIRTFRRSSCTTPTISWPSRRWCTRRSTQRCTTRSRAQG